MPPSSVLSTPTTQEMRQFLASRTQTFSCDPIPMAEARGWRLLDGMISHESGGFFSVVAASFDEPAMSSRPVVLLYQPQSALNCLLTTSIGGELHFLLQARIEPGNIGVAQYGPTVQSTPANYLRVHKGKATPYLDLFFSHHPGLTPAGDWTELDLGGRYLFKNKRLVYVDSTDPVPADSNFVWVAASTLKEAVLESALLNTDLRSMLGVMPWARLQAGRRRHGELSRPAQASLCRPIRPEVIGRLVAGLGSVRPPTKLIRLDELDGWELSDYGLFEREPSEQGFDVQFFQIEAPTREVVRWMQPLVNSRSSGRVVLAVAVSDGALFVLVNRHAERGLSTGTAVFPSDVSYPGQNADSRGASIYEAIARQSATIVRTVESDEGGRFFQDASHFEVHLLDERSDFGKGYEWITLSELKCLLAVSNACSLQLRCIASALLGLL